MKRAITVFILLVCCAEVLCAQQKHSFIAFASDTQEPMWIETLFLKSDHNLEATKMIFKDVDAIHPSAFFILGDVVSLGRSNGAWKNIDKYIKQTVKDSIPVYATLGNHEVMFGAARGVRNFKVRFPMYDPAGYVEIVDSVAVILLNSNFAAMDAGAIAKQDDWYQKKLKTLDADAAIRCVIVGCHHSPYTNSTIVRPSVPVQQHLVPPFMASKKCVLFVSGHSHNYERFKVQGKNFLVIGGGGGLHQPLAANNDKMRDLSPDYKPPFHYLEVSRDGNNLNILSRKLKKDFSGFDDGLSLQIKP